MDLLTITKLCTKCKQEKPLDAFNKQTSSRDGLKYECKQCASERNGILYTKDKQYYVNRAKHWNSTHPDKVRIYKETYRLKNLSKS